MIALGAGRLAAVGLATAVAGCQRDASSGPSDAVSAGVSPRAGPAAVALRVASGNSAISGEVLLRGPAPAMQPFKLGADPICARGSMRDEQVLVADGKLANAVVRLADAPPEPPPPERVVIDQVSCVFRPRVQGAVRGQLLEIRNGDSTLHNAHGYAGTSTLFNYAQPAGAKPAMKLLSEGGRALKLKCDVHPWMTAYIFVCDNRHFAVTGADGNFSLKGIPAGTYRVEAWHERFGTLASTVTVPEGQTAHVTLSYSPNNRG
jgi:hypothetical protein